MTTTETTTVTPAPETKKVRKSRKKAETKPEHDAVYMGVDAGAPTPAPETNGAPKKRTRSRKKTPTPAPDAEASPEPKAAPEAITDPDALQKIANLLVKVHGAKVRNAGNLPDLCEPHNVLASSITDAMWDAAEKEVSAAVAAAVKPVPRGKCRIENLPVGTRVKLGKFVGEILISNSCEVTVKVGKEKKNWSPDTIVEIVTGDARPGLAWKNAEIRDGSSVWHSEDGAYRVVKDGKAYSTLYRIQEKGKEKWKHVAYGEDKEPVVYDTFDAAAKAADGHAGTAVPKDTANAISAFAAAGKPQTARKNGAVGARKSVELLGKPAVAVLRWMGHAGWTLEEAKKALAHYGLAGAFTDVGVKGQLWNGKQFGTAKWGDKWGALADLSKAEIKELTQAAGRK